MTTARSLVTVTAILDGGDATDTEVKAKIRDLFRAAGDDPANRMNRDGLSCRIWLDDPHRFVLDLLKLAAKLNYDGVWRLEIGVFEETYAPESSLRPGATVDELEMSSWIADKLKAGGMGLIASVSAASNEELDDVPGIGPGAIKQIDYAMARNGTPRN